MHEPVRVSEAEVARATARRSEERSGAAGVHRLLSLQQGAGNHAVAGLVQRVPPPGKGEAADHDWNAKSVPQRVKNWAAAAQPTVRAQYETTLSNMASTPLDNGDGMLAYLHGWNHKRFGGHWCLLYRWQPRRDGQGFFLAVKGIGRKAGGNDYALAD